MIFGQWYGEIRGDVVGEIIINIDQNFFSGSVMLLPTDGSLPCVIRLNNLRLSEGVYTASLEDFMGFLKDKTIFPPGDANYQLASAGTVEFKVVNEVFLEGEWTTNLPARGNFKAKNISGALAPTVNQIISWEEFKALIPQFEEGLFFRGHKTSAYPLRTIFHRKNCWDLRRYFGPTIDELFDHLTSISRIRLKAELSEDLIAGLHLAQHHCFPTPLLDWTLSPYVAAFFAFDFMDDPVVDRNSIRIYVFDANAWKKDLPGYSEGALLAPGLVIKPIKPSAVGNKRSISQDGCSLFSNIDDIFGVIKGLGEQRGKTYIRYYDIKADQKEIALKDLRKMRIHELSLFSDIDHACLYMKRKYFG